MFGNKSYRLATPEIASSTRGAKRILLVELGGLGDLVHSLPAMWTLRQTYPDASLHCIVQAHNASLLECAPWIDVVIPCRRDRPTRLLHYIKLVRLLRAQDYDLAIEFMGTDFSCAVVGLSGAARRLVRNPGDSRIRYGWRFFSSDVMECEFKTEPVYMQKLNCLRQAGFETSYHEFKLTFPRSINSLLDIEKEYGSGYLHISPFTKVTRKELPPEDLITLLTKLAYECPHYKIVMTCSGNARELAALDRLLEVLPFRPWKVYRGTLSIPDLYALIKNSALHLGGDSGALHLAWLAATPSVSWFKHFEGFSEWAPLGAIHKTVCSNAEAEDYLRGIPLETVVAHTKALLQSS